MNKSTLALPGLVLLSLFLVSCTGDIDGFTGEDSSSTNIIDDGHFWIGLSDVNPKVIEDDTANGGGITVHGDVSVTISAYAADKNGAKVTSGTIYFATEYGQLSENSCSLGPSGSCSIVWTSELDFFYLDSSTTENSITAYTIGEESFIDENDNNAFDDGEILLDTDEPYIDVNDDGVYTLSDNDRLIDIDFNGIHTVSDGAYNGSSTCNRTLITECSTTTNKTIYEITYMELLVVN